MTTKQYLDALKKLGLTPAGKATAEAFGVSVRQCQRWAAGENIPQYVCQLVELYIAHGLPTTSDAD